MPQKKLELQPKRALCGLYNGLKTPDDFEMHCTDSLAMTQAVRANPGMHVFVLLTPLCRSGSMPTTQADKHQYDHASTKQRLKECSFHRDCITEAATATFRVAEVSVHTIIVK